MSKPKFEIPENPALAFITGQSRDEAVKTAPTQPIAETETSNTSLETNAELTNELIKEFLLRWDSIPETKSERYNLLIKPTLKEMVARAAELNHTSSNELINRILENTIKELLK